MNREITQQENKSQIIWRSELMAATGWTKRYFKMLVKKGKLPKPDIPHRDGRNGSEPGWEKEKLVGHSPQFKERWTINDGRNGETEKRGDNEIASPAGLGMTEGRPLTPTLSHEGRGRMSGQSIPAHCYSGRAREIMALRSEALNLFQGAESLPEKRGVVEKWNIDHPENQFSLQTLYRLHKGMREGEDLFPRWGGKGLSIVPDEPYEYFKKMYLTQQQRPASVCHYQLLQQCPEIPNPGSFMRRLQKEIPAHIIYYYRRGPEAYNRKFGRYIERDYSTIAPGQMYVMDHHQVDVAVCGTDGKPLFPWATVCADIRSRKYLGWVICIQPNSDTIHLAFRRACLRFGLPSELYIDNGKDFRSRLFAGGVKRCRMQMDEQATKTLLSQLNVIPRFALPYNPQSKPIERSFLTLKERFSRLLPTFRGGDVTERPEELQTIIDSGKILSLRDFEKLYGGFVEAEFNNAPHRGNGMDGRTPNEVWAEGNVAKLVDEENLALLLLKNTRPTMVGRNGVTLLGRTYWAENLFTHKGEWIYLRYDPGEIGRVWVYTVKDEFVCQAQENQLLAWNASEADLKAAMAQKKRERKQIQAYHQMQWDRNREPDLLKGLIAKKAAEHGVDLREDALQPEKPLLQELRISAAEREKLQEEEEDERRRISQEIISAAPTPEEDEGGFSDELKRYLGVI